MSNKALDFYRKLLASLHMSEQNGIIFYSMGKHERPLLIDDKEVVFPSQEMLKDLDPTANVVFHPLSESIRQGESKVLRSLRSIMKNRINYTFSVLLSELCSLFGSTEINNLSGEQLELISKFSDLGMDTTFVTNFHRLMSAGGPESDTVEIYVKRMGEHKGKKHFRVAVSSFPMLARVREDAKKVKFRQKDVKLLEACYDLFLPNHDVPEYYNAACDSKTAPSLQALLDVYSVYAQSFNVIIERYLPFLPSADFIRIPEDVFEYLEPGNDLDTLLPHIRAIGDFSTPAEEQSVQQQVATQPVVQQQQPVQVQQPVQQQMVQQPVQQQFQQPQFQQVQQQPTPGIRKTSSGKIEFDSIREVNPMLDLMPPVSKSMIIEENTNKLLQQMQMNPNSYQSLLMPNIAAMGGMNNGANAQMNPQMMQAMQLMLAQQQMQQQQNMNANLLGNLSLGGAGMNGMMPTMGFPTMMPNWS